MYCADEFFFMKTIHYFMTRNLIGHLTWLILHRVILALKVKVAMLAHLAHQDLREALVSLVSKDNW